VTLKYDNLDRLLEGIRLWSHVDLWVWKIDLKDAYFHISVASRDAPLLAFHMDGGDYCDFTRTTKTST